MPSRSITLTCLSTTVALTLSSLFWSPPPASALDRDEAVPAPNAAAASSPAVAVQAIREADAAGAVTSDVTHADGSRTVTITAGDLDLALTVPGARARLGAGKDKNGVFVDFNSFDQQMIIGGGGVIVAEGMCALGPAVCVIANVVVLLAVNAINNNGGVRCGSRSLRVHASGKPAPFCA
jgi:hypothetical protein